MSESNYCTCGECGYTWDYDANPTPAHRCPREADHVPTAPTTRWPSVAADEHVVWYCGADGSWGECLAGDLLIIPERALTPDENAALDNVPATQWDETPGDIIAAAIERSAR